MLLFFICGIYIFLESFLRYELLVFVSSPFHYFPLKDDEEKNKMRK